MKKLNVRPLHDRVIIQPTKIVERVTPSGLIILPDKEVPPATSGIVRAIGTDAGLVIKVGELVHFSMNSGFEIEIMEEVYLIMREKDITLVEDPS